MISNVSIERMLEVLDSVNPRAVNKVIVEECCDPEIHMPEEIQIRVGSNTYYVSTEDSDLRAMKNRFNEYKDLLIKKLDEIKISYKWYNSNGELVIESTVSECDTGAALADDPIREIERFQKDRLLDKQSFDFKVEVINILEELVEMTGIQSAGARKVAEEIFKNYFESKIIANNDALVDCFNDIRVFSIGATMKLGYKPRCTLLEVSKEINSRVGKIVDGKFIKDKSPEAQANWYKANFEGCKR